MINLLILKHILKMLAWRLITYTAQLLLVEELDLTEHFSDCDDYSTAYLLKSVETWGLC